MALPVGNGLVQPCAVITGASRGIGRAIAERFCAQGWAVISLCRSPGDLPWPELPCDVSQPAELEAALERAFREHGEITALVNNAGLYAAQRWPEQSLEEFRQTMAVNAEAVFVACRAFARHLISQGRAGSIVNLSSVSARIGSIDHAYVASKAAVEGLTRSFAMALAGHHIRVNAVAPGPINTGMGARIPAQRQEEYKRLIFQGRFGEPEEVAALVAFLASPEASLITGEIIACNGGIP